jgi:hypothetical protein
MDHTPESRSSAGPIVGTIIIVILLVLGALYFWGAQLNRNAMKNQLPIIPGDATTTAL